jgi:hypothetical protein
MITSSERKVTRKQEERREREREREKNAHKSGHLVPSHRTQPARTNLYIQLVWVNTYVLPVERIEYEGRDREGGVKGNNKNVTCRKDSV